MIPWNAYTTIAAVLAVCGALVGSYTAGHRAGRSIEHSACLEKARVAEVAALATMDQARADVERVNQQVQSLRNQIEVQHERAQKSILAQRVENERLARELGGLRDPGAAEQRVENPMSGHSGAACCDCGHPAAGRLSAEAERFLLAFAYDADQAAQYARDCHDWAVRARDEAQSIAPAGH